MTICTPVTGNTLNKFLTNLKKIQEVSSFIELRVDFINNFNLDQIEIIQKNTHKKAIFTCRVNNEGGHFKGSEAERIDIIQKALELGFDYVDIELSAINKIDLKNKAKKTQIICSYHDFQKTPSYERLQEIAAKISKNKKCDIVKIVAMVKKETDNQKLFRLLTNKDPKQKMITLGMGELGKVTRILSPFLGGYLTFASVGGAGSAPGQVDFGELEGIYKKIT